MFPFTVPFISYFIIFVNIWEQEKQICASTTASCALQLKRLLEWKRNVFYKGKNNFRQLHACFNAILNEQEKMRNCMKEPIFMKMDFNNFAH